ncbi:MAG: hypothetical protein QG589_110 [Patescibacteria group bacterium]|jgi:hypothetical protein|nr:hypothetical protein [Patescibacteria group bacterium]
MNILPKEIITEWGLQSLPEQKQIEIVDRIGHMLYQAVLVRSLDILSDEEQEEFDVLLDNDGTTPQDVLVFLHSKIPTFQLLVAEEKDKLKDELMLMKKSR